MYWLIEKNARRKIEQAEKNCTTPHAQQIEVLQANSENTKFKLSGNTAEIDIKGVITKNPNFFAMMFGGGNATYPAIVSALTAANNDQNITNITLNIDSPGGEISGLYDVIAAMQNTSKPIKAVISNVGASAAYAIASQADEIYASNIAASIGSVGLVATFYTSDNEIDITSTNAPKKRPDVKTDEGVAMVREELDSMHELFVDVIAKGRNVKPDDVNKNYGQGATLLAGEALKRGMIDGIQTEIKTTTTTKMEKSKMDIKTLESQHPELYAQVLKMGVDKERDRVSAHLIMGEKSGAMATASEAIQNGSGMTETYHAKYLTAGMNKSAIDSRQEDDQQASAADNTNNVQAVGDVEGDQVVKAVYNKLGL